VSHVAFDQRDRPRVLFDEDYMFGTPTQCFDSDSPGARTPVEDPCAFDAGAHDVEQGFT
jgi:hypothetical protein